MTQPESGSRHFVETESPAEQTVHSISLGAGVQSTTMYLMAAHGVIQPTPASAIFADTQWEPPDVYRHLEWLISISPQLPRPIPIHVVSAGDLYANVWSGKRVDDSTPWTDLPTFTINGDGSHGMSNRQCTQNYKIKPILAKLRELLERPSGRRHIHPPFAAQWIGISFDEWHRMRESRQGWIQNAYPLVDMRMSRQDCLNWFQERYPERPLVKSACIGCPYHSNREWLRLYRRFPEATRRAAELDEHLRTPERAQIEPNDNTRQFLHRSCRPPSEALERLDHLDRMQPSLFPNDPPGAGSECGGYCHT